MTNMKIYSFTRKFYLTQKTTLLPLLTGEIEVSSIHPFKVSLPKILTSLYTSPILIGVKLHTHTTCFSIK